MSATTSVATTTGTAASSTCTPFYEFPEGFKDVGCAALVSGNITDVFDDCCKGDSPVKYNDDCNIYCLAQNQDLGDLRSCLINNNKSPQGVFCQPTNGSATATASATTTGGGSTGTGTSTSSSATTSTSGNAAIVNQPISKSGLGIVAMVFCSAVMGMLA